MPSHGGNWTCSYCYEVYPTRGGWLEHIKHGCTSAPRRREATETSVVLLTANSRGKLVLKLDLAGVDLSSR